MEANFFPQSRLRGTRHCFESDGTQRDREWRIRQSLQDTHRILGSIRSGEEDMGQQEA